MRKIMVLLCVKAGLLLLIIYGCQNMAVEMSKGQRLYSAKCSSCHILIAPQQHNKAEWAFYIGTYGEKMTSEEKQALMEYLGQGR